MNLATAGRTLKSVLFAATGLVAAGAFQVAQAQAGGAYNLGWNTIDSGGTTTASGGAYGLGGTAGQPDAGSSMTGAAYHLTGGFWFVGQTVVAVGEPAGPGGPAAPTVLRILPSAPNPFRTQTAFTVELPAPLPVTARIYNPDGQLVRSLCTGPRPAGRHQITWDARDDRGHRVARGVYLLEARVGVSARTQKLVLVD